MKEKIMPKCLVAILFIVYFCLGIFLYKDYGISTDEPDERHSVFTNIKYVLDTFGIDALSGANGDLENYIYKYYGVAMQIPPAIAEGVMGFPDGPEIWHIRHLWTFIVCFIGYICFYLMCHEILKSRWMSLIGTAMLALYPRFFAEQFYNIKDMMFVAMFIMSMYATIRLRESNYSVVWVVLFSIITALTTNVRIVGAIFPIILLGYLFLIWILKRCKVKHEECETRIFRTSLLLIVCYIILYIAFMPILWKNPVQEMIAVFSRFADYDVWSGTIVFAGKIINNKGIPWYYIPVWLLISIPVWYLILFVVSIVVTSTALIKKIKKSRKLDITIILRNKYTIFVFFVGFFPWLATVIVQSTLYNGWRHCYFILPSIIFVTISGLSYVWKHYKTKRVFKGSIAAVIIIGLLVQGGWIINNHPYEMVYFNSVSRKWADCFDRDYWHLSVVNCSRYILEHDTANEITIQAPNDIFLKMLSKEEKKRISIVEDNPMYYIDTYRGKTGNGNTMQGYLDWYSISINGYRIATIYKRQN